MLCAANDTHTRTHTHAGTHTIAYVTLRELSEYFWLSVLSKEVFSLLSLLFFSLH